MKHRQIQHIIQNPSPSQWMIISDLFKWVSVLKDLILRIFSSVQFSRSVVSDSLRPHELQHTRPSCPSQTPGVLSDSRPLSQWCHPAISSSVVPFSSCPQSLPAWVFSNESTLCMRWPSTGVSASASFPPKKSQGWSPSEWTGWISYLVLNEQYWGLLNLWDSSDLWRKWCKFQTFHFTEIIILKNDMPVYLVVTKMQISLPFKITYLNFLSIFPKLYLQFCKNNK